MLLLLTIIIVCIYLYTFSNGVSKLVSGYYNNLVLGLFTDFPPLSRFPVFFLEEAANDFFLKKQKLL